MHKYWICMYVFIIPYLMYQSGFQHEYTFIERSLKPQCVCLLGKLVTSVNRKIDGLQISTIWIKKQYIKAYFKVHTLWGRKCYKVLHKYLALTVHLCLNKTCWNTNPTLTSMIKTKHFRQSRRYFFLPVVKSARKCKKNPTKL